MIKEKYEDGKKVIYLDSLQGNSFYLLSVARDMCIKLNKDYMKISKEMKSGGYENLIKVFDREFGNYIDLQR